MMPRTSSTGVSFVVPVYNKAPWLPRVLDYIAAQRGRFEREYIFVDDGSTDGSLQILREHTAGWTNLIIIEQANHGVAHATNRGIERASMPFIKLCDADDLLATDATAFLLDALCRHSAAVLAWGAAQTYESGAEIYFVSSWGGGDQGNSVAEVIDEPIRLMMRNCPFNPAMILVRTDAAHAAGGCDERLRLAQDYSIALRLARQGPFVRLGSGNVVAFIPRDVPGRLSSDEAGVLRDMTRGLGHFVREHPDLPRSLKQYACRRAASRAWTWTRRNRRIGSLGWFRALLRARFPATQEHAAFIARCAEDIGANATRANRS